MPLKFWPLSYPVPWECYLGRYLIYKLLMDAKSSFDYRLFTLLTALTVAILLAAAVLEVTISLSG